MRTIYCSSMDDMIDLATAFIDGGLSGLRDAIRQPKEIDMSDKQYDNSNQLGLWKVDEAGRTGYYNGYGDIGGSKVYDAYLVVHSARNSGKGAFASLFFRTDDGWKGVDIWNNEGKLGGRMETEGFWVNVFKNDVESGSKRPALSVKFKPMEAAAAASAAPTSQDVGEIPF